MTACICASRPGDPCPRHPKVSAILQGGRLPIAIPPSGAVEPEGQGELATEEADPSVRIPPT